MQLTQATGVASRTDLGQQPHGAQLRVRRQPCVDDRFIRRELGWCGDARPVRARAFIDTVERVAADVVRLRLELADGEWMDFRAGQYLQIRVPGAEQLRSYSVASSPDDLPNIELLVRLLPGGVMSRWLTDVAAPDDLVEVEGPFGSFFLRESVRAPQIMIAGGTGLAPMISMIDVMAG